MNSAIITDNKAFIYYFTTTLKVAFALFYSLDAFPIILKHELAAENDNGVYLNYDWQFVISCYLSYLQVLYVEWSCFVKSQFQIHVTFIHSLYLFICPEATYSLPSKMFLISFRKALEYKIQLKSLKYKCWLCEDMWRGRVHTQITCQTQFSRVKLQEC